jgi:hypothetical protein
MRIWVGGFMKRVFQSEDKTIHETEVGCLKYEKQLRTAQQVATYVQLDPQVIMQVLQFVAQADLDLTHFK